MQIMQQYGTRKSLIWGEHAIITEKTYNYHWGEKEWPLSCVSKIETKLFGRVVVEEEEVCVKNDGKNIRKQSRNSPQPIFGAVCSKNYAFGVGPKQIHIGKCAHQTF
jgi:hypothetical protein